MYRAEDGVLSARRPVAFLCSTTLTGNWLNIRDGHTSHGCILPLRPERGRSRPAALTAEAARAVVIAPSSDRCGPGDPALGGWSNIRRWEPC